MLLKIKNKVSKRYKDEKGETILGVLMAVVVFLIISLSALSSLYNAKFFYLFYDKMAVLQELLKLNLIEVENKNLDQYPLPTTGQTCILRRYSSIGRLASETRTCNVNATTGSNYYILIQIEPMETASPTFEHEDFMKMPTQASDRIYQFKIFGHYFDAKTSQTKILNVVYLKGS